METTPVHHLDRVTDASVLALECASTAKISHAHHLAGLGSRCRALHADNCSCKICGRASNESEQCTMVKRWVITNTKTHLKLSPSFSGIAASRSRFELGGSLKRITSLQFFPVWRSGPNQTLFAKKVCHRNVILRRQAGRNVEKSREMLRGIQSVFVF